jgi:hypothetical protein
MPGGQESFRGERFLTPSSRLWAPAQLKELLPHAQTEIRKLTRQMLMGTEVGTEGTVIAIFLISMTCRKIPFSDNVYPY